jgi:GTP-binding protein
LKNKINTLRQSGGTPLSGPSLNLEFLTSAANLQGCPNDSEPEVALVGRSNAGKSSLLNGLSNSRVAKVSSTPGKTRLLNFFTSAKFRLVDMPGYGFSKRSGVEQNSWQAMIEPFLVQRPNLRGLLIVMDIRRDWSIEEQDLVAWIAPRQLGIAVALTKADKLSRSEGLKRLGLIRMQSGVENMFLTSSLKKTGYFEVEDYIYKNWIAKSGAGR